MTMQEVVPSSTYRTDLRANIRRRIEALFGRRLDRILLYGSRARGEARQDSDWDVAVLLKDRPLEADREAAFGLHLAFFNESNFRDFVNFTLLGPAEIDRRTIFHHALRRDGVPL